MKLWLTIAAMLLAGLAGTVQAASSPLEDVVEACSGASAYAAPELSSRGWRSATDSELAFALEAEHLSRFAAQLAGTDDARMATEGREALDKLLARRPSMLDWLRDTVLRPDTSPPTVLARELTGSDRPAVVWIEVARRQTLKVRCTFWGYAGPSSEALREKLMEIAGPAATNDVARPMPLSPRVPRQSAWATSVRAVVPSDDGPAGLFLSVLHTEAYQDLTGTLPPAEVMLQITATREFDANRPH